MSLPLVSIIVPTYNSHVFLEACLKSLQAQTYTNIEIIIVDRGSNDGTIDIARKYADKVFQHGNERSSQRNYGVAESEGTFIAIIDSDMELSSGVITECVNRIGQNNIVAGVIIPEESFGESFWARCKALERSFYRGNDDIEAARFFTHKTYNEVGGYDDMLAAGEDWDLSGRIAAIGSLVRISEPIYHNEGNLRLLKTVMKKYNYAKYASRYFEKSNSRKITSAVGPIQRYKLFLSRPNELFRSPITGFGMLFMKTLEYVFGMFGYLAGSFATRHERTHK